jgi:hypothetical protein
VATWQQDRYSSSAAAGIGVAVSHDGGDSWERASVPRITDCAPASNHASDPWVSVGGDGTVYLAALVARPDRAGFRTRIAISASRDGGATWPAPALLDAGGNGFNDKPSVTADPLRRGRAYAVWTLEGQAYVARTRDAGRSWSPPRLVERASRGTGLLASTIAVLPGGRRLLHTFIVYGRGGFRLEATRSGDDGRSWSGRSLIARLVRRAPKRPPVRVLPISGTGAATTAPGSVYEAFVERGAEIDVASSSDGGGTWSRPRAVARHSGGLFGPALAAAPAGALAVTYYVRGPGGTASVWIATSRDGIRWQGRRLTAPFDLTRATRSGAAAFLGDYRPHGDRRRERLRRRVRGSAPVGVGGGVRRAAGARRRLMPQRVHERPAHLRERALLVNSPQLQAAAQRRLAQYV